MLPVSNVELSLSKERRDINIQTHIAPSFLVPSSMSRTANLTREQKIRESVLQSFSVTSSNSTSQLLQLSLSEWKRLLPWLDASGLALYLLDNFTQLGLRDALPPEIAARLQQNQHDNTQRTNGMVQESVAIQREFQKAGLTYAVMKGISLAPWSVPRPELRHQFDLDYLMDELSAPEARSILERRGYRLLAVSGNSWEFKINEMPNVSTQDLYKDLPYRGVELHLESNASGQDSRLSRAIHREMFGITMPLLSPIDICLGQAMHAFKDICSPFSRAAHLLEFYRHVLVRRDDDSFWHEFRHKAEHNNNTCLAIGVVTYLITIILGDFAPELLTSWTVATLPPPVRLFVDIYARHTVFSQPPGTKIYLILQKELEVLGVAAKRTMKQSLLPNRLPAIVVRGSRDETLSTRLARYCIQLRFFFSRLKFHVVEGFRYGVESYQWRQRQDRLS